jgi:A/G-specific adenine glycosylase
LRKQPKQPTASELQWFRRRVLRWSAVHGRTFRWRNPSASTYERIVSEVLLQRTRAETVDTFFSAFMRAFPSWRALSAAEVTDLERFLRPLGLWRRRAASLKKLASAMATRRGKFPRDRHALESLPNVGQYIANAIELLCHASPRPLIDVNMARILERFFGRRLLADIRYDPYLQELAARVVNGKSPAFINWAILDLSAKVCRPKPHCTCCPLQQRCIFARASGTSFPINPQRTHK